MKMKYFNYEEFDSPDVQGSGQLMNEQLLHMLDAARKEYGKPIIINSGYRTEAHNEKVGGKPNSSHLKGLAVDIACKNSLDRAIMEAQAISEAADARNTAFQRLALGLGWRTWDVNAKNEEFDLIKTEAKARRKEEGKEKAKKTRAENTRKKNIEKGKKQQDYWNEYYRKLDSIQLSKEK